MLLALIFILATGVTSYVGMMGVYHDMDLAQTRYYQQYHLADFTLDVKRAPSSAVNSLMDLPNVERLRARIRTPIIVSSTPYDGKKRDKQFSVPGEAVSLPVPRRSIINDLQLHSGRFFSHTTAYEAIVEAQFAKAHHLVPGDRIQLRLPNKEYSVLIVGTAYSPEFTMILPPGTIMSTEPARYGVIFLPNGFLEKAADLNNGFNQLLGLTKIRSKAAIEQTMIRIADQLDIYGVQWKMAQADQISVKLLHDELQHLRKVSRFFPTLFLLVAVMVFNVMMSRLVFQQRGIIGILKAIGYSSGALMRHYLLYGVMVGLLGGLLGVAGGMWLQTGMLYVYRSYFAIPPLNFHAHFPVIIIGMSLSVFSAVTGAGWSVWRAIRFKPAEAMRPPMPEQPSRVFLERFPHIWQKLSFQNKMVFRTIFRNRFRSLVTFLAAVLAAGIVFTALSFLDSIETMINFSFDMTQHQDFQMTLRDHVGPELLQTLKTLPGVIQLEPQLTIPAEIRRGERVRRLSIIGLPSQNRLFTPVNRSGQPIVIPQSGLVLTKTLAGVLDAKVGDLLTIEPLLGSLDRVTARVQSIVPTYMGLGVYANQSWLSRLVNNRWVADQFNFRLRSRLDQPLFIRAVHRFGPLINLMDRAASRVALVETLNRFILFSITIMILFAGVIAMGTVLNTAIISLSERERQVASLRVLGFSYWQVAKILFNESAWLNLAGIIFGLGFGIGLAYYMSQAFSTELFAIPFVVKWPRLIQSVVIMSCFVLISQGIIYRMIRKMNWFDVLNVRE
jgi:putative ABC transport system permease protein